MNHHYVKKMAGLLVVAFAGLMLSSTSAWAGREDPKIIRVIVNSDNTTATISGLNFVDEKKEGEFGAGNAPPVVRIGWGSDPELAPLTVTGYDNETIDVELPDTLGAGDYKLSIAHYYPDDDDGKSEEKKAAQWDLTVGAVGPQGDQGIQGKLGDTGAQGVQGKLGDTGAQGVQGKLGDTGAQGVQGKLGDTGAQGVQGKLGDTGAQGVQGKLGDTGAQGVQGKLGDTGAQGVQGKLGDTGAQGVQGKLGDTGAQGVQGKLGDTGAQGVQGKLGDTGAQGVQGKLGDTGAQGVQGKLGDTGAQGVQGKLGDTGAQGVQGKLGDTGAQGDKGDQGDSCSLTECSVGGEATLSCGGSEVVVPCVPVACPCLTLTVDVYLNTIGGDPGTDCLFDTEDGNGQTVIRSAESILPPFPSQGFVLADSSRCWTLDLNTQQYLELNQSVQPGPESDACRADVRAIASAQNLPACP